MPVSNILVPTDFSEGSRQALDYAVELAERLGARLHVLHVVDNPFAAGAFMDMYPPPSPDYFRDLQRQAQVRLQSWISPDDEKRCAFSMATRTGLPATEILQRISEQPKIDLVVMATHGRGGVERFVMGSVADRVIRGASCPVLTIREHPRGAPGREQLRAAGAPA